MRNSNGERGAERGEMARTPFLDAVTADRLLDGEPSFSRELAPLERLLSAARAPGRPSEFAREQAAIAAFQAAWFAPAAVPERSRMAISWRRLLTVKAATVGLVGLLGGVAVAAGVTVVVVNTDESTTPTASAPGSANGLVRPSSPGGPGSPTVTGSGSPSVSAAPTSLPSPTASGAGESTAPIPPNVIGLCQQWRKRYPTDPGGTAADPHFAGLIAAAGGVDKVADFCTAQEAAAQATPTPTSATRASTATGAGGSGAGSAPGTSAPGGSTVGG
jgi:hypothetical protein